MDSSNMDTSEIMARIEAQVNAQMGEVFREQVTDKCFAVCADVSRKQMSSRETDCISKYVCIFNLAISSFNGAVEAYFNFHILTYPPWPIFSSIRSALLRQMSG